MLSQEKIFIVSKEAQKMSGELLSPFATFLLGVAAFLKIILHFPNPIKRELRENAGKTAYQVEHEFERSLKKDRLNVMIIELGSCLYMLLVLLYTFVIDPLVVITAIVRKIGYQPIAYFMLIIVGIACYIWIRTLYLGNKASNRKYVEAVELDHIVPYRWIVVADKLRLSQRTRYWIRRIFPFLPDLYFWYLLLVVLGVLS
jgi:hypothetical protein